jgi:hypothetical protein
MIKAYMALWKRLTASRTVKLMMHILDNEASEEFKREIRKNCTIQLVPPDNSQTKSCGTRVTNLQKSLQSNSSRSGQHISDATLG